METSPLDIDDKLEHTDTSESSKPLALVETAAELVIALANNVFLTADFGVLTTEGPLLLGPLDVGEPLIQLEPQIEKLLFSKKLAHFWFGL